MEEVTLHWADYVIFGISLAITLAIGIFYGVKDLRSKNSNSETFLVGNRNLGVVPISASIFVSFFTAVGSVGDPVESYRFGAVYIFTGVGYMLGCIPAAHFFATKFNEMKIISAFEFLGDRFNNVVRVFAPILTILFSQVYVGISLYATAISASQLIDLRLEYLILLFGGICLIYTTVGGIKAVVWTDTVQVVVLMAGLITVAIVGCIEMGGIARVFRVSAEGKRLNFFAFDWDPRVRPTVLGYICNGFIRSFAGLISNQVFIQRYASVSSPTKAAVAVYIGMPFKGLVVILSGLTGMVMYTFYADCDPLLAGRIKFADQLMPLFMKELLGKFPGLVGLFLAAIASATLSTMSSVQNGFAAIVLQDFIKPVYMKNKGKHLPEKYSSRLVPLLAFIAGITIIGIAIGVIYMSQSIFSMGAIIAGVSLGPFGAMFFIAILVPYVDGWSMTLSFWISFILMAWLGAGRLIMPKQPIRGMLPVSTEQCPYFPVNETVLASIPAATTTPIFQSTAGSLVTTVPTSALTDFYQISPLYYGIFGFVLTLLLALLFGLISYCLCRRNKPSTKKSPLHDSVEAKFSQVTKF